MPISKSGSPPTPELGLFKGFYKCEYGVTDMLARSVMYVHEGSMLGGNSAFAHGGSYHLEGDEVVAVLRTYRHNYDPKYPAMLGTDSASIHIRGAARPGGVYYFEGSSPEKPGAVFRSKMTPIEEGQIAPPGEVGEGGIFNGLYSVHLRALDGVDSGLTGVMLLNEGRILGGDAFFYYLGSYSSANGRWRGQIVNQEHTSARSENPVFGGHEVGIGFSGACRDGSAELEGTALAGKISLRLTAQLKLVRRA